MYVEQMRKEIASVYKGKDWSKKVDNMPDNQVIAMYYKFKAGGKFDKKPESRKQVIDVKPDSPFVGVYGEQLSMFDSLKGE